MKNGHQSKSESSTKSNTHKTFSRPSLSVSQIKKHCFSHRHQSLPVHHFVINDDQQSDVIHTTIRQSGDDIGSILNEFHNRSGPKKSIVSQRSVQLTENKILNNAFEVDYSRQDLQNEKDSSKKKIKKHHLVNIVRIDSNQTCDNDGDVKKNLSISSQQNFTDKSNQKLIESNIRLKNHHVKCLSLCKIIIPIVILLTIIAIVALVMYLTKPTTETKSETNFSITTSTFFTTTSMNFTNTTISASTVVSTTITTESSTSTTTSFTTSTNLITFTSTSAQSTTLTITNIVLTASTTPETITSTTVSTDSTTATTQSTTSTTTSTDSTTSSTTSTDSTTSTTTTTESTTTTTTPSMNPCISGLYWNVIAIRYAGDGNQGSTLARLRSPSALAISSNDTLYISDSGNYRIVAYLPNAMNGTLVAGTGIRGNDSDQFGTNMRGIFLDANGNMYISDRDNNRIMRWISGGSSGVIVAGNGTLGTSLYQLDSPYGVWVDSSSNVFVTDFGNHRITKWSSGASVGVLIAGITGLSGGIPTKLSSPTGVYYDELNQNLYISNYGVHTVMRWRVGDPNGTVIMGIAGSSGSNSTQLNSPVGITFDQWQNLYIADRINNRIQLVCNGSSTAITIIGRGTSGSNLSTPFDIKLDSQLNLYVAEYDGHRVTKFLKL